MSIEPTERVTSLETERCKLIVTQDFSKLRNLLSSRLVHVHTRGNQDTRDSYLHYLANRVEILDLQRENLQIQMIGESAAVMYGKQINRARLRGKTDEVVVEAQVMQVWAREDDGTWRQLAFQATPIGAPPPAVPR
jgi:ketosteroid isomerase-like protein